MAMLTKGLLKMLRRSQEISEGSDHSKKMEDVSMLFGVPLLILFLGFVSVCLVKAIMLLSG